MEVARVRQAGKSEDVQDLPFSGGGYYYRQGFCKYDNELSETLYTPREYFVLTDAGKPVYIRCAMPHAYRRRM